VDCGLSRQPKFTPHLGLTHLETVQASRATREQRRGRAGRTEPGICYRLWDEREEGAFAPFQEPEIKAADLSSLILEAASWGVSDIQTLFWLDRPPQPAVNEAISLLQALEALEGAGHITTWGRQLRALPLAPRLAKMVLKAEAEGLGLMGAYIALLLSERGLGGDNCDVSHRLNNLLRDNSPRAKTAKNSAKQWVKKAGDDFPLEETGRILAFAFPERIAKSRGKNGEYLLSNGRGALLDPLNPLVTQKYISVAELAGSAQNSRILSAASISQATIESDFKNLITTQTTVEFDLARLGMKQFKRLKLGAFALNEQVSLVPFEASQVAVLQGVLVKNGLALLELSKAQQAFLSRVNMLFSTNPQDFPDLSDEALIASLETWLMPILNGKTSFKQVDAQDYGNALYGLLDYKQQRALEAAFPSHFTAPSGQTHPINYEGEIPVLSIRVQELFGLKEHPCIGNGKIALLLELLSPGHRPVQMTRDLIGFWHGSYASVKAEMKGRYPKHPWPENPMEAPATHRAKPRGT
jgi:ATP-dependent helicase HrpB